MFDPLNAALDCLISNRDEEAEADGDTDCKMDVNESEGYPFDQLVETGDILQRKLIEE